MSWQSVLVVDESEKHLLIAGKWLGLSHNVISTTLRHVWIRTPNISCDMHWCLHRYMLIPGSLWSWPRRPFHCSSLVVQTPYKGTYVGTTRWAWTAHPPGAPVFTPIYFVGFTFRVVQFSLFCIVLCYSIFSFICMLWRSLFVLLYFFLLAMVLSVLLYTVSDCSFGIFKLLL